MAEPRAPFRADHVGSLLRPHALKDARAQFARGAIDAAALAAIEDREIERLVTRQQALGLHVATDGELRRSWWHLDFLWGLAGVAKHTTNAGVAFAGAAPRNEGVRVDDRIAFRGHPMLAHFAFLAEHTRAIPKLTIPAPSALTG